MVTGLYASLAASASVFIGILSALLASNVSNTKSERSQIQRRVENIDARLQSLESHKRSLEDTISEIENYWVDRDESYKAEQEVNEFIRDHISSKPSLSSDAITVEWVTQEFADFKGIDPNEIGRRRLEELSNNMANIRSRLDPMRFDIGGLATSVNPPPNVELGSVRSRDGEEWEVYSNENYSRTETQLRDTDKEIRAFKEERQRLSNRFQSLDYTDVLRMLWGTAVALLLSVFIPSIAFLARVIEIQLITLPEWVEPTIVFGIWVIGFVIVLVTIYRQINNEDSNSLEPDPDQVE